MIANVYSEFYLKLSEVVKTVTDSGSNMVKAFRVFGKCESNITNPEAPLLEDRN